MGRPSKIDQVIHERDPRTDEVHEITVGDAIVRALRSGAYVEDAAEAAGVSKQTVYNWLARGDGASPPELPELGELDKGSLVELAAGLGVRQPAKLSAPKLRERIEAAATPSEADRRYVDFFDEVEKARAGAVVFNLALIRRAAQDGNWQAAAWWLERTRPRQFGRRQVLEHEGGVAFKPQSVDLSALSDDELDEYERLTEKAGG